jgi:hypothetical protein
MPWDARPATFFHVLATLAIAVPWRIPQEDPPGGSPRRFSLGCTTQEEAKRATLSMLCLGWFVRASWIGLWIVVDRVETNGTVVAVFVGNLGKYANRPVAFFELRTTTST